MCIPVQALEKISSPAPPQHLLGSNKLKQQFPWHFCGYHTSNQQVTEGAHQGLFYKLSKIIGKKNSTEIYIWGLYLLIASRWK